MLRLSRSMRLSVSTGIYGKLPQLVLSGECPQYSHKLSTHSMLEERTPYIGTESVFRESVVVGRGNITGLVSEAFTISPSRLRCKLTVTVM